MKDYLDNKFDKDFDKINGLSWYPWVGKNYTTTSPKVLILGLSQYAVDEDKEYCEATEQGFMNKEINREFLFENIKILEDKSKFYTGLYNTYCKGESLDAKYALLNKIAFYNFFQTVDQNVSGNKRNKQESLTAWAIFHQIINIIKPDICIFHGKDAHKHMEFYFQSQNIPFQWEDVEVDNCKLKINSTIPVRGSIIKDKKIDFLFCKHPSIAYSVDAWRDFIFEMYPEMKNL
ncbi:hypothetical protein QNH98_02215 [Myroides sp. mNGS23_01]|nr:hypothetical protein [Myroides sp. mNGS23_01]WHT39537.1 hypothetical protein QNH98_02215 [Myroides sp. mNGS23_01]